MGETAALRRPLWMLWASQPLDIITTAVILTAHAGQEGNPLTAWLIGLGGLPLVLAIKMALVAIITVGSLHLSATNLAGARKRILIVTGIYVAVLIWNSALILVRT